MVSESVLTEVAASANRASGIAESEKSIIFENNDFTVELVITADTLKEALAVMREGFYSEESICKGVRLGEDLSPSELKFAADVNQISGEQSVNELEALTLETAKDGISLVAIDKKTGKVAGAAFNKIQQPCGNNEKGFFETFRDNHCQSLSATSLMNNMIQVDSRFDAFDHYKVNKAIEVMFLATSPAFRRRGVGGLLMKASFEAAKSRGIPLVVALFSSIYTQRIGHNLGMTEFTEVRHDELFFLGEPMSLRTGIHKTTTLMAKRIGE